MKQVIRKGLKEIIVDEVADPMPASNHVLVCPFYSLIAGGTTVSEVKALTNGRGADCVIVAAASKSPKPLQDGVSMACDRGRVVMVGACPIEIPRAEMYVKELSFMPEGGIHRNMPVIREELLKNGHLCSIIATAKSSKITPEPDVYHPRIPKDLIKLSKDLRYYIWHVHLGSDIPLSI